MFCHGCGISEGSVMYRYYKGMNNFSAPQDYGLIHAFKLPWVRLQKRFSVYSLNLNPGESKLGELLFEYINFAFEFRFRIGAVIKVVFGA